MMQELESFTPILQVVASHAEDVCVPREVAIAVGGMVTALCGASAAQWRAAQKRNQRDWELMDRWEKRLNRLLDEQEGRRWG